MNPPSSSNNKLRPPSSKGPTPKKTPPVDPPQEIRTIFCLGVLQYRHHQASTSTNKDRECPVCHG